MKKAGIIFLALLLTLIISGACLANAEQTITGHTFIDLIKKSKASVLNLTTNSGEGSGFIVKHNGEIRIITNKHVVAGAFTITTKIIIDNFPTIVYLQIVSVSTQADLAILKFSNPKIAKQVKPIELGDSNSVQAGQFVLAMGNAVTGY